MNEAAHRGVLDRTQAEDLGKKISEPLDSLRVLVDEGTRMVVRCFHTSEKTLKDIVALFSMFKSALSMVDAIEVMMRKGVVHPCLLQVRSLFEVSVTLQWILQECGDERAKAYHVANLRRQRLWASRYLPGSAENQEFQGFYNVVGKKTPSAEREKELRKQIAQLDVELSGASYSALNGAFEAHYRKRGFDQEWYKAVGAGSFRQIAKEVDRSAEYSVIYVSGSELMHGSTYSGQVTFDGSDVITDPIRSPEQATYALTITMLLTLKMLQSTLKHYREGELENFLRKCATDWRLPWRRVPQVTVKPSVISIDR